MALRFRSESLIEKSSITAGNGSDLEWMVDCKLSRIEPLALEENEQSKDGKLPDRIYGLTFSGTFARLVGGLNF